MRPALILSGFLFALSVRGESGYDAWLRYQAVEYRDALPAFVVAEGDSPVIMSARDELIRGIREGRVRPFVQKRMRKIPSQRLGNNDSGQIACGN